MSGDGAIDPHGGMGKPMRQSLFEAIAEKIAIVAGWLLIGLSLLVTFETIARKFFGFSTQGANEIGGYVLAISATGGFSYALLRRAHIRIDPVARLLPIWGRVALDLLAFALLNIVIWLLLWRAIAVTWGSFELGARAPTPLQTPLVIPQGLWTLALAFFGLVALVRLAGALKRLAAGRPGEAVIDLDVSTLRQELEEEVTSASSRRAGAPGNREA